MSSLELCPFPRRATLPLFHQVKLKNDSPFFFESSPWTQSQINTIILGRSPCWKLPENNAAQRRSLNPRRPIDGLLNYAWSSGTIQVRTLVTWHPGFEMSRIHFCFSLHCRLHVLNKEHAIFGTQDATQSQVFRSPGSNRVVWKPKNRDPNLLSQESLSQHFHFSTSFSKWKLKWLLPLFIQWRRLRSPTLLLVQIDLAFKILTTK